MNPLALALFQIAPYVLVFSAGVLIPRRQGTPERIAIGIVAALALLLVRGLWPSAAPAVVDENAKEWPYLLSVIVFLPILGAIFLLFLPRQSPVILKRVTFLILGLDGLVSLGLLSSPMTRGWHFQHIVEWVPAFGIRYHVAVDGVSMWLILLSTLTTPIAAYVAFGSIKTRIKDLCFSFLLLHGAMMGVFVALDMFLFFVFWELLLIPMIVMIGVWGGTEKIKAAYKFFLYTMVGSMLMLGAILFLVWNYTKLAGYPSFDYLALQRVALPHTAAWFCFFAFFLAFAIKVPMFPFHTWLPDAHVQAPTGGSVILAAVLLKLGAYGYIRFCMGLLGGVAWMSAATLAGFAIGGGIVYGALVAWKQDDVKRLVAYSSVAHMGFVMLGLFAGTQSGMEGAVLQMLNHGVSSGALFLLVGCDLRSKAHALGARVRRPGQGDADLRRGVRDRHHVEHRRAGHQRFRGGVHGHHGHLRLPNAGRPGEAPGRSGFRGRDFGGRVHAVGGAARVLRPAVEPQEQAPDGHERA